MKLSILITYHGEGEWLTECIAGVLPQLGSDDEVIVYDDASQPAARRFLPADTRVRCVRGDVNIGPARARDRLIAESAGDLLHFHDADDLFAPEWHERVCGAFASDIDAVFTDAASFDEAGGEWRRIMDVARLQREGDLLAAAFRGLLVPSGTYRRTLIDAAGGYGSHDHSEDYGFHLRIALRSPRFAVIDQELVRIRRHRGQRSLDRVGVWTSAVEVLQSLAGRVPQTHHDELARAATRAGSKLFEARAPDTARRAFRLAQQYGGPVYDRPLMNALTRGVGAMRAETLAARYRNLIPRFVRSRLQKAGL